MLQMLWSKSLLLKVCSWKYLFRKGPLENVPSLVLDFSAHFTKSTKDYEYQDLEAK